MNNSHDAIVINQTNFKKISKKIKKNLEELNLQIPLTAVNEVFAKSLGYRNYDALHSALIADIPLSVNTVISRGENQNNKETDMSCFPLEKEKLYKTFFLYMKQRCTLNIISQNKNFSLLEEHSLTYTLERDMQQKDVYFDDEIFIQTLDAFFSFSKKYMEKNDIFYLDFFNAPFLIALNIALDNYKDKDVYYSTRWVYFDQDRKKLIFSKEEIENEFFYIPNIRIFFNFIQQCLLTLSFYLEKTLFSNNFLNLFVSKYYNEFCNQLIKPDSSSEKISSLKNHVYYSASFFSHYEKQVEKMKFGNFDKINNYFVKESQQIFNLLKNDKAYQNSSFEHENFFIKLYQYDKMNNTKFSYKLFNDVMQFNSLFSINHSLIHML